MARLGRLLAALAILGVVGCGGTQPEPVAPDQQGSSDSPETSATPTETAAELRRCERRREEAPIDLAIAEAMRDSSELDASMTPPLPVDWPPTDARLQYFVYEARALPTAGITYEIREPHARILLDSIAASHSREPLTTTPGVLGRRRDDGGSVRDRDAFDAAQQALLDVASQRRCPEDAREDLRGYCAWFALHDPIIQWATPRHQSFVDWLACNLAATSTPAGVVGPAAPTLPVRCGPGERNCMEVCCPEGFACQHGRTPGSARCRRIRRHRR